MKHLMRFPSLKFRLKLHNDASIRLMSDYIVRSKFEITDQVWELSHESLPILLLRNMKKSFDSNEVCMIDGSTRNSRTFGDVHDTTYRFASALRRMGFKTGDCITIISPNHFHFFTTFIGTALTGAHTSTMNPAYTEEEIEYQVKITRSRIIFAHPSCIEKVSKVAGPQTLLFYNSNSPRLSLRLF